MLIRKLPSLRGFRPFMVAAIAQLVERLHGKEEVPGSNPGRGSLERAWRASAGGESARRLIVRCRGRVPVPRPTAE